MTRTIMPLRWLLVLASLSLVPSTPGAEMRSTDAARSMTTERVGATQPMPDAFRGEWRIAANCDGDASSAHDDAPLPVGARFEFLRRIRGASAVHLRAEDGDSLPRGWQRVQLSLQGAVPLQRELPCGLDLRELLDEVQQGDLQRIEGSVCLGDHPDRCHDHFALILARRVGTLGPRDDGVLMVLITDDPIPGYRIRRLEDAAALLGRSKAHEGDFHDPILAAH